MGCQWAGVQKTGTDEPNCPKGYSIAAYKLGEIGYELLENGLGITQWGVVFIPLLGFIPFILSFSLL